ncbi:MAG: hypothetical protein LC800_08380 [Acidobacteria bacterium]|nr:hypothetical protein [Acidobacteriota bacterium]
MSGPDFHWEIMPVGEIDLRELEKRKPITYGEVPEGFRQVSPKDGMPPPTLFEGGTFNATLWVRDKGGANINFTIHNGKVLAEGS